MHVEFFGLNLSDAAVALKFRGMYQSFFASLARTGVKVSYTASIPLSFADVYVTSPSWPNEDLEIVASRTSSPIVLHVPSADVWFDKALLNYYRERLLFVYTTARSKNTESLYREVGIGCYCLPLATDPDVMVPLGLRQPLLYDLVFAGGLEHRVGSEPYIKALLKEKESRKDLLLCTGGERFGVLPQTVTWGSILNLLYNLSNVGVNFHSKEQKQSIEVRQDLNNRAFDLAAAGCFQVSDNASVIREYFAEDEVLAFDDANEWIEAALYFCAHPEKRQSYRERARQRVLLEHTWDHRARLWCGWLEMALVQKKLVSVRVPPPHWLRIRSRVRHNLRRVRLRAQTILTGSGRR